MKRNEKIVPPCNPQELVLSPAQSKRARGREVSAPLIHLQTSVEDISNPKVGEENTEWSETTTTMTTTLESEAQSLHVALKTPTIQSTNSVGAGRPLGRPQTFRQMSYSVSSPNQTHCTANCPPSQGPTCKHATWSSCTCRNKFFTNLDKSQRCDVCLAKSISDSRVKNQTKNHAQNIKKELSDQNKAFSKNSFARSSCESSLLTEVLSWRRTNYSAFRFFTFYLVLIQTSVYGSESPDRECCENPLYTFDNPERVVTTFSPPALTYRPPEEPDIYPEVPDLPGVLLPTPATGSLSCLLARQLCLEDSTCSQILQVIPRVCGLEQVVCSTITVSKCQAALRTLRSFPYFNPTCLCKPPTADDHQCNDFSELLFDHPCLNTAPRSDDPYPVDALPYCTHAEDVCNNDNSCKNKVVTFQRVCKTENDKCVMDEVSSCHMSWQNLRQSPIFGCICPANMPNKKRCDQIFQLVNGNPCIDAQIPDSIRPTFSNLADAAIFWEFYYRGLPGYSKTGSTGPETRRTTREVYVTSGTADSTTPWYIPSLSDREYNGSRQPTLQDQEIINMRSTCHLALDNCERDAACRPYLDSVKSRCVDSCNRERCMSAVQEFYRKIPRVHALDIAFCLCKKQNDDQCFRAQSLLHPVCAQTPASWSGREEDLPLCHDLSNSCKSSSGCGSRLLRYEQACAVDAKTKTCAGPYEGCRNAMLDILGTELRTNCGCGGPLDFRKLFDCIGYQRLLWMNPCIVDAQKDYHLRIGNTEGPGPEDSWSPQPGPMYTEPPYRPPPPPQTPARPPDTPKPFIPYITTTTTPYQAPPTRRPQQTRPPDPTEVTEVTELTEVVTEIVTTSEMVTQVYTRPPPPTPFGPTIQPTWPQPPTLTTRRVFRRTTARPFQEQEDIGGGGGEGVGGGGGRRPTAKISTSTTTTTTTLPPKYCKVEDLEGSNVKYIREGFEKRFYTDGKEGSNLCSCKKSNGGSQHFCTYLQEIERKPCNTGMAFYSHNSPFYLAGRGQCLCYSGQFICAKPDFSKGSKDKSKVVPESPPGVYLYLGYSRIDAEILKQGRMKLNDEVPLTDDEEENEVKNTIQQTVSHFTSNTNKSDCRIRLEGRIGENYILKATLDEFDEFRMKKNMSDYMKYKEKDECYEALESIASKVNARDADMRSHIILSMFKVAEGEANTPDPPPSSSSSIYSSIQPFISSLIALFILNRITEL